MEDIKREMEVNMVQKSAEAGNQEIKKKLAHTRLEQIEANNIHYT